MSPGSGSGSNKSSEKKDIVSNILSDDMFSPHLPHSRLGSEAPGGPPSPHETQSGSTTAATSPSNTINGGGSGSGGRRESTTPTGELNSSLSPEDEFAKNDPLATQVWKMYSKQRSELPNGQRMENLTWRMMAMTLRKKEAAEAAAAAALVAEEQEKARRKKEREDNGDLASFLVPEVLGSGSGSGSASGEASGDDKDGDSVSELPAEEEARGRRGRTSKIVGFNAYAVDPE